MTPEEYIQSIIDAIDSAVEPNSITPEMVATVMAYLMTKTGTLSETVGGTSSAIQTMQSAISNIMTQLSEMSDTDDDVAASIQDIWTAIAEINDAEPVVDTEIKDSGNPVANRAILSAITSITSSISGKESTQNKIQSITSLSDHTQYPTAKAVYLLVQTVSALISDVDDRVDQNQNAINGLDSTASSIAGRVTAVEGKVNNSSVSGKTVTINGNSVNVADIVLGYYLNGFKTIMSLSLPSMSDELTFSMMLGSTLCSATGVGAGLIESLVQELTSLGYTATFRQTYTYIFEVVVMSSTDFGVVRTVVTSGITFSYTTNGGNEGFYTSSSYEYVYQGAVDKIYIDVETNMMYRFVSGNSYEPLSSQPFTSGSYDSVNEEIVLNYAGGSLRIPVGDMLPEFTAGQGISIRNGVVSQDYLVVTADEMERYLEDGVDDGRIRYVYEE